MSDEESHCYLSLENKKSGLEKVWRKSSILLTKKCMNPVIVNPRVIGSVVLSNEPVNVLYGEILVCNDVAAVGGYPGLQLILYSLIHVGL